MLVNHIELEEGGNSLGWCGDLHCEHWNYEVPLHVVGLLHFCVMRDIEIEEIRKRGKSNL